MRVETIDLASIILDILRKADGPLQADVVARRAAAHPQWELKHWEIPARWITHLLEERLQTQVVATDRGWALAEEGPSPATAPQRNGHDRADTAEVQGEPTLETSVLRALRTAYEPLSAAEIAAHVGELQGVTSPAELNTLKTKVRSVLQDALAPFVTEGAADRWRLRQSAVPGPPYTPPPPGAGAADAMEGNSVAKMVWRVLGSASEPLSDAVITAGIARLASGMSVGERAGLFRKVRHALQGALAPYVVEVSDGCWRLRQPPPPGEPLGPPDTGQPVDALPPAETPSPGESPGPSRHLEEAEAPAPPPPASEPAPNTPSASGDTYRDHILAILGESNEPIPLSEIAWAVAKRGGVADVTKIKRALQNDLKPWVERVRGGLWRLQAPAATEARESAERDSAEPTSPGWSDPPLAPPASTTPSGGDTVPPVDAPPREQPAELVQTQPETHPSPVPPAESTPAGPSLAQVARLTKALERAHLVTHALVMTDAPCDAATLAERLRASGVPISKREVETCLRTTLAVWTEVDEAGRWRLRAQPLSTPLTDAVSYDDAEDSETAAPSEDVRAAVAGSSASYRTATTAEDNPALFSYRPAGASVEVVLNQMHPAYERIAAASSDATLLLLAAWARLESDLPERRRERAAELRQEWGRVLRALLREQASFPPDA